MDEHATAIERLTRNERDCLRRRLQPQTAKEIATDLGISTHAVEKRLKMARAKLGVTSSLVAARLLLAHERRYLDMVPQISDLSPQGNSDEANADRRTVWRQLSHLILGGIVAMSILIAVAATLFAAQAEPQRATRPQALSFLERSFNQLDRDRSGFVELSEAPAAMEQMPRSDGKEGFLLKPMVDGVQRWMSHHDANSDGKVDQEEFVARSLSAVEKQGIPTIPGGGS